MISGGRLLFSATVKRASTTTDALGRRTNTFSTIGDCRCDLRSSGNSEQNYADGVANVINWEVRVRWPNVARLGITTLDRLSIDGKTLRINAITNLDMAYRVAVIDCTEVN